MRPILLQLRRARIVVAGVLVLGLLGLVRVGARARSEHLALLTALDGIHATDPSLRAAARARVSDSGADVAPRLVGVVRQATGRWHAQVLPWLDALPGLAEWRERKERRARAAIELLQRLGPDAVPALVPLLADRRFGGRDTAVALLRAGGTNSLPTLVATLNHSDPEIRAGALVALGKFPSRDLGDLEVLRRARRDSAVAVRLAALWALGQFRDRPDVVVAELTSALSDPSDRVRLDAIQGLRPFASHAGPAVEALRRCLSDRSPGVRAEASVTLAQLGRVAAPAQNDLLEILRRRGSGFREAAAAVVRIGETDSPERQAAYDLLRQELRKGDVSARIRTVELLSVLGVQATSSVPDIVALLENDEPRDDRAAVLALRHIQPEAIPERFRRGRPARRRSGSATAGSPVSRTR